MGKAYSENNAGKKSLIKKIIISFATVLLVAAVIFGCRELMDYKYKNYRAADPEINNKAAAAEASRVMNGDFYVSINGSDANTGEKDLPFRTVEKAMEAVKNTEKKGRNGITVCIEPGEYNVSSLVFNTEDSGTAECPVTYRANGGKVVINAGVTLHNKDFISAEKYPQIYDRLPSDAKKNVAVLDLTKDPYSLTAQDWGKIFAIGSYNTANKYDGDWTGPIYSELFINDKRQNLARYPDDGFLLTQEVVSEGQGKESDGKKKENWDDLRNPEPDVYKLDEELAERISGWETLDDVWMFGFWKYDWADASTPVLSFNKTTRELTPKFVSLYGAKTEAPYYFFNVLEELSTEGEWYLDRENGLLCLWKPDDFDTADIKLSLSDKPVVSGKADHIIFDGLTFQGSRNDAVALEGDGITVKNCVVKNVAGNAVSLTGSNNLACDNEITHTGKGGIILTGGDTETLRAGSSKAENNLIHDWSEIYQTYQPAVTLNGVGNICAHNEIYNSPHEAITYTGNNHIIEYNLIHDVCLLSDDAGAIYAGRSWVWYGNVIRYNCIYSLGSDGHEPNGIYMDDALSGQEIYGNLLVNIPQFALHLGGGRDLNVYNNIIINAGKCAVSYDERARDGALSNGWFDHAAKNGDMWKALYSSPWKSEVWQSAFPQYKKMTDDFSKSETAEFIPNP
ncbi:MAG: right-handed parallel beta-helix repeat-containing protein, partial [Clostridia bacterium]|nr:right-handed parallel beta-helix repeat-containing protein [Clostridia bacterium]